MSITKIESFVFYFDVIGVVDQFLKAQNPVDRLEKWQSDVRDSFIFMEENTTCKTMFNNAWRHCLWGSKLNYRNH